MENKIFMPPPPKELKKSSTFGHENMQKQQEKQNDFFVKNESFVANNDEILQNSSQNQSDIEIENMESGILNDSKIADSNVSSRKSLIAINWIGFVISLATAAAALFLMLR